MSPSTTPRTTAPTRHAGGTPITFSFGENWKDYLTTVGQESIQRAMHDIVDWLGSDGFHERTVLDIGCGSGIHSFCFYQGGARQLVSFDVDPASVEATSSFWQRAGRPEHWTVMRGSILDESFARNLGRFDIVYSWGVLHHTGAMWSAIDKACGLVSPAGQLWISLYTKGPAYPTHLTLKQRYNRASALGKTLLAWREIVKLMGARLRRLQNPLAWNQRRDRGMNVYHDLIDWLGGLPYEVASPEEVIDFCRPRGFALARVLRRPEGDCSTYLFRKKA